MSPEQWQQVKRIFNRAVEIAPAEREAFLENEACGAEIFAAVKAMLAADEADDFGESPVANLAHLWRETDDEEIENFVGKRIGNYKLISEIGRGGMGIVFEATRDAQDFSQRVALKILKRGMDSAAMLRRFRSERQILASLEHPNIARLLDGGRSPDGLPFFALELVEGEPLDEYCRAENLSVGERLRLFRQICAAVSFAHSRLIIHRDLKPTNILVNKDGAPKLLDFGIAKIISDAPEDNIAATITRLGMMTPRYASPEQARGEIVTTASDVYSLGLILYEILTMRAAYEFPSQRADEIARVICEVEPKPPSSVVTAERERRKTSSASTTGADNIGATADFSLNKTTKSPAQNPKLLRGDLDNIVLKALRKEPNRRYASVEQFSEDVRRHLEGLPVTARPTTAAYRLEKFVGRNRAIVAAGILLFLTLGGGIAATAWQAVRAERERVLAEKRFNQVRALANNVVFKYNDGIANLQGSTEIRKTLARDATEYLDNLSEDAGDDTGLLHELAKAYVKLADVQGRTYYANVGDTNGAIENYGKAIEILEKLAAMPNLETRGDVENDLIGAYQTLGTMQSRIFAHADSIDNERKALALVEAKVAAAAPADIEVRYLLVRARYRLADSMHEAGQFNEAMEIYRSALAQDAEIYSLAPENENVASMFAVLNDRVGRNLALRAVDLKHAGAPIEQYETLFVEAEARMNEMLSGCETLAAAHPENRKYRRNVSSADSALGMIYRETGKLDRSRRIIEEDLRTHKEPDAADAADREAQADLSDGLTELAQTEAAQKEFPAAFADFTRAVEIYDGITEADAANLEFRRRRFDVENNYADALLADNQLPKALETYRAAFEKLKKDASAADTAGDVNSYLKFAEGLTRSRMGDLFSRQKNLTAAADSYRKALELWTNPEALPTELNRSPERIGLVREKLSRITEITQSN